MIGQNLSGPPNANFGDRKLLVKLGDRQLWREGRRANLFAIGDRVSIEHVFMPSPAAEPCLLVFSTGVSVKGALLRLSSLDVSPCYLVTQDLLLSCQVQKLRELGKEQLTFSV